MNTFKNRHILVLKFHFVLQKNTSHMMKKNVSLILFVRRILNISKEKLIHARLSLPVKRINFSQSRLKDAKMCQSAIKINISKNKLKNAY